MKSTPQWSLGAKLGLAAAPFLFIAMCSIGALLWMSWQIEGGAASVNEAGRMRMHADLVLGGDVA